MSNDPQCARFYRAERDVLNHVPQRQFRNLDAVVRFVARVIKSDWYTGPPYVVVEERHQDAPAADSLVDQGVGHIRLPRWAWNKVSVLHELAHLCSWRGQDHGPAFARRVVEAHELFGTRATFDAYVEAFKWRGVRTR